MIDHSSHERARRQTESITVPRCQIPRGMHASLGTARVPRRHRVNCDRSRFTRKRGRCSGKVVGRAIEKSRAVERSSARPSTSGVLRTSIVLAAAALSLLPGLLPPIPAPAGPAPAGPAPALLRARAAPLPPVRLRGEVLRSTMFGADRPCPIASRAREA